MATVNAKRSEEGSKFKVVLRKEINAKGTARIFKI